MKASELREMIRTIVAEELRHALPLFLSEMYVKKIVAEHVSVPVVREKKRSAGRNLAESLGMEDDAEIFQPRPAQKQVSREQLREKFRKSILDDPEQNPMAALYEGTMPIDESAESEGVPLEMLGIANFDKFIQKTPEVTEKGPIKETREMAERRIERQRAQLDSKRE